MEQAEVILPTLLMVSVKATDSLFEFNSSVFTSMIETFSGIDHCEWKSFLRKKTNWCDKPKSVCKTSCFWLCNSSIDVTEVKMKFTWLFAGISFVSVTPSPWKHWAFRRSTHRYWNLVIKFFLEPFTSEHCWVAAASQTHPKLLNFHENITFRLRLQSVNLLSF